MGFEAAENVLHQTAPLARDGVDQRPQFGGVLKVPQQFVIGAAVAPILAAVGAIAALIGECTISVEREEEGSKN